VKRKEKAWIIKQLQISLIYILLKAFYKLIIVIRLRNNSNIIYPFLNSVTNEEFKFFNLNIDELNKKMRHINNKTSGMNNLNINVISDAISGHMLLGLINDSFHLGKVPENWKKSTM
jgi:hypothetical protein